MKNYRSVLVILIAFVLGTACSSNSPKTTPPKMDNPPPVLADEPIPGPLLSDLPALEKWIDEHLNSETRKRVRIPVYVRGMENDALFGVPEVRLGDGPESPQLKVDDSGMGISFLENARHHLQDANEGWLWLEGFWGGLILSQLEGERELTPFAVRKVEAHTGDSPPERVFDLQE